MPSGVAGYCPILLYCSKSQQALRHNELPNETQAARIELVDEPPVTMRAWQPPCVPAGPIGPKFEGAAPKCEGLAAAYRSVADELGCAFFDAGSVTASSRVDGVHLDADQHGAFGRALVDAVDPLLA
jgi:lysophospholipase L1-like esterase